MRSEGRALRSARDRTRVLYLGWWNDAADALTRHRCDATFVVDPKDARTAADHGYADQVVIVPDATRADDVVSGLQRESICTGEFDIVCTELEQCLVSAAIVAQAYGCVGLALATAVALRDKAVQKNLIRRAGIPVTRCRTVADIVDLQDLAALIPFVVKPLAGAGSQLTYVVSDQESLQRAVSDILSSGRHGPWLVEDFVDGPELHLDGVVRAGVVVFLAVSRYMQNVIDIREGGLVGSIVMNPGTHSGLYERAHDLASASLSALVHTDGVFHLEVFDQGDRLVFSECAGRIGGGMIWEATKAKFGVDLYDEWARAVLGLPAGVPPRRSPDDRQFGWVHLTARPGHVTSIPDPDTLRKQRGVVAAEVSIKLGDAVPDATLASHFRAARVVMTGESETTLEEEMKDLWRWFRDQVHVTP